MRKSKEAAALLQELMLEAYRQQQPAAPPLSDEFRPKTLSEIRAAAMADSAPEDGAGQLWSGLLASAGGGEPVELSPAFKVKVMEELRDAEQEGAWNELIGALGWRVTPFAAALAVLLLFAGMQVNLEQQMVDSVLDDDPYLMGGML